MKICIIIYHKNVTKIYPLWWVETCKQSLLNQTYNKFDVLECCYGGEEYRVFENSDFEVQDFPNFVHAMNYLLDKAFNNGYDYVLNVNLDDHYHTQRIEKQLPFMEQGVEIISSNFSLVRDNQIIHTHRFQDLDIEKELDRGHNPVCHPVVAYSKMFWEQNRYVPTEIPYEDKLLWQRAIKNGNTFVILPDVLCYHRLHGNSVCQSENR